MPGLAAPNIRRVMSAAQSGMAGGLPSPSPGGVSTMSGTQPSTSITPVTPWGTSSQVIPGVVTPYFDPSAGPTGALVNPTGGGGIIEHNVGYGGGGGGGVPGDGGGGGGGGGAPGPGRGPELDTGSIMGLINQLKGPQEPKVEAPQAPEHVNAPVPAAKSPASDLGFARFKDRSGRIGAAALRQLKDTMTERGLSDSGIESAGEANILGQVAAQQSDAAYQQESTAENQAWQAAQQGYQGDLSQRNADIGVGATGYQGGIQQRGQDMQTNNLTNLAPSLLSLMFRSGGRIY